MKSSKRNTHGVFVEVPETKVNTPTEPADCRAAVESAAVTCQVAGSVAVDSHTFARMVVGAVPVTCSRVLSCAPAT